MESDNEKKIFTRVEDFSLFEPSDKVNSDLKIDFPELAELSAFKDLQARELRFVWMVANRTSPIITLEKEKRIVTAVSVIFGKDWKNVSMAKKLAEPSAWTARLIDAMEAMSKFNPNIRLRARLMTEYMFDQLQVIIIATPQDIKNMDPDGRKKYAELLLNVNARLPEVVSNLEKGYGIVIKKTKDETGIKLTAAALSGELANE